MSLPPTTIPQGSWILVTGANGYIASHVVNEFLERGYKVRGTVRDVEKSKFLIEETFAHHVSEGSFEIVPVPDMAVENAFDEAVKGVSAVAHVATITTGEADPNKVIPQAVAGAVNALKSATKERSIKEFVFTSSAVAAHSPVPDTPFHVDANTWNDEATDLAWTPPFEGLEHGLIVYAASKVAAEKAVWKFRDEEKPHFTINCVNPFATFGRVLHKSQKPWVSSWLWSLYRGETEAIKGYPAFYYINVRDVATMHVAAILDPEAQNERIHTWSAPFNWNDCLAILRDMYPERKFVDDLPGMKKMLGTVEDSIGRKLMKRWAGQEGWTSLEDGIRENLEGIA